MLPLLAALALAARFGELPFAPAAEVATCIRPAGPGAVSRWLPTGAELLAAGPQGIAPQARVRLGRPADCPAVASDPSGAAVAAAVVERGAGYDVMVSVSDAGGGFRPALRVARTKLQATPVVAVSARGEALVLVSEQRGRRARILSLRRPAHGRFTAAPLTGRHATAEPIAARRGPPAS